MSIHFTKSVPFGTKTEAFEQRGLQNAVSAKCVEAGVFPVDRAGYHLAIKYANLQFELQAIEAKASKWYNDESVVLVDGLKQFKYYPFEGPVLCVESKNEGGVLNSLGLYETGTGKLGLYAGSPNLEQIGALMNMNLDMYTTVPAGNVNIAGYLAWIYAWRGINAYFAVGGGKNREYVGHMYVDAESAKSISGSPATMETKDAAGRVVRAKEEVKAGGILTTKQVRQRAFGTFFGDSRNFIITPDDTLESPGFIFEYFREMLEADPDAPFNDFVSLYHNCIATSQEELSELLTILRRGFRYLCHSQPGKIVQHIYWGIKASIKLGGDLRLIQDGGRYAGFIILTTGQIVLRNRVKMSLSAEDLTKHLGSLNRHSAAVANICNILDILPRIDGKEQTLDQKKAKMNPRILREAIQAREAVQIEEVKTELVAAIGDLRYAQDYWPITPENILRFFLAMAGRHNMENEPLYVNVETLTNRSSEVLPYLAVFGSKAPAIHYGNKVMSITPLDKEDPNLRTVDGKAVLPYIPYEIMGTSAAAGSWATAKKARALKFKVSAGTKQGQLCSGKDRAGVIAKPHFDPMYAALRQWIYSEHEVRKEKGKKALTKRGADEMEEPEASTSKKSKVSLSFF